MILTKDNLLRFVRENKFTTPTKVAESFDTSTMIASAALSELVKDKYIALSHMKFGSTPYYYDLKQKNCLIELAEKLYSGYDKETLLKLKEHQVLNDNSLSIQERLAMARIKDFAVPVEISHEEKEYRFWIWYLLDIDQIKSQLYDALKQRDQKPAKKVSEQHISPKKEQSSTRDSSTHNQQKQNTQSSQTVSSNSALQNSTNSYSSGNSSSNNSQKELDEEEKIEEYLSNEGFRVESKKKDSNGILYTAKTNTGGMTLHFDCYYYFKKPLDSDIISFYTSSMKPKIIFVNNAPKKLFKLTQSLDNCKLVRL